MKYVVFMERYNTEAGAKIHKHEALADSFKAIEVLKDFTELFSKEIKEGTLKVYMIME